VSKKKQHNTIQYLHLLRVHSQPLGPNLRHGQSLGGRLCGGLKEGTSNIMCLEMFLKRCQERTIMNFNRDLIPY